jgi:hypothetical protein
MPIFFFEFVAAGFIAGSIPIKGISYLALFSNSISSSGIAGNNNEFAVHFK